MQKMQSPSGYIYRCHYGQCPASQAGSTLRSCCSNYEELFYTYLFTGTVTLPAKEARRFSLELNEMRKEMYSLHNGLMRIMRSLRDAGFDIMEM